MDDVSLHDLPILEESVRHDSTSGHIVRVPFQTVVAALNSEVSQGDFPSITLLGGSHAEEMSSNLFWGDMEFKVTAVVSLRPLQRLTVSDNPLGDLVCRRNSGVLSKRGGRADGCSAEFHTDGAGPAAGVVWAVVEPGQVTDPVNVGISRDYDVVANVVIVEGLQGPVLARHIAIPSIQVQWLFRPILECHVQLREYCNV